jgi:hypothetical protein
MCDDKLLELGLSSARLIVRGERYETTLAWGLEGILRVDAGVGITTWRFSGQGGSGSVAEISVVGPGMPTLKTDAIKSAMAVAQRHPSFQTA